MTANHLPNSLTTVVMDATVPTKSRPGPTEEIQQVRLLSGTDRFDVCSLIVVRIVGGGVVRRAFMGLEDI